MSFFFLEVGCSGYFNGSLDENTNNNGSTAHDGVKGIRVDCVYESNRGPNVVEVNPGTETWNFDVTVGGSIAGAPATTQHTDFRVGTEARQWLHNCTGGAGSSYGAVATGDGIILKRNTTLTEADLEQGGTIGAF